MALSGAGHALRRGRRAVLLCRQGEAANATALATDSCINLRLPTHGDLYAWEFEKNGHKVRVRVRVRVEGRLVVNGPAPMLDAALAGLGLAYLSEDIVQAHLDRGQLVRVLDDWCPPSPGYHLYHPSGRQQTPAFSLLLHALRHRG